MKKIMCVLLFALITTSCALFDPLASQNSKMQNVILGMTKDEVIVVLGKKFTVEGLAKNENNEPIETIAYEKLYPNNPQLSRIYILTFVNGKLHEWHIERPFPPALPPSQMKNQQKDN